MTKSFGARVGNDLRTCVAYLQSIYIRNFSRLYKGGWRENDLKKSRHHVLCKFLPDAVASQGHSSARRSCIAVFVLVAILLRMRLLDNFSGVWLCVRTYGPNYREVDKIVFQMIVHPSL